MKDILKMKFKVHRLVNYLFYIIIFFVGFFIGFGAKNLNIRNIISQLMFIDNVEAKTLATVDSTVIDEDYIYNEFKKLWSDFNIKTYNNIYCELSETNNKYRLLCRAFTDSTKNAFECSSSSYICSINNNKIDMYEFDYNFYTKLYNTVNFVESSKQSSDYSSGYFFYPKSMKLNGTYYTIATNYDRPDLSDDVNKLINTLDFTDKTLEFNENLFKNDENFKQVCVNNYDTFSITSNDIQDYDDDNNPVYHNFDFIWFPNGMKGISTWIYDSEDYDHVFIPEKDENSLVGWWCWLNNKSEIDLYFDRDNPGMYLKLRGYKNKYNYYNYTFYPFEMTFTTSYHRYQVFWFKDPYIEYLDGTKKDDSTKYCFYIKKEFDVNILNKNQNGDYESTINILGSETDDKTYKNEFDLDPSNSIGTINNFIFKIKPTITFINTHLFNFYTHLPNIVRMFIFSVLVIFIIILILRMVGK